MAQPQATYKSTHEKLWMAISIPMATSALYRPIHKMFPSKEEPQYIHLLHHSPFSCIPYPHQSNSFTRLKNLQNVPKFVMIKPTQYLSPIQLLHHL